MKDPYVVIGIGRSGTSTVAGILYYLGVKMGKTFLHANERNPMGYYEDVDVIEALNEGKVMDTLKSKQKKVPWGVKILSLVHYYKEILKEFPNVQFVIVNRDKEKTMRSLMKTMNKERAEKVFEIRSNIIHNIWEHYRDNAMIVNIDDLSEPDIEKAKAKVAGLAYSFGLSPSEKEIERAGVYLAFTSYGK